jgi:hypothetical protein
VPTPVRVRARALYPAGAATPLESFSDTLSVSTGLPIQRSMSLSVDRANIDGGNFDGEIATLTVRLADQFSNPVPDGTVVNFIGSGGAVCTSNNGSCRTTNGACTCQVTSQERRPQDRRVVITAYAVGLEDFDDRNGNNLYDVGDPFVDLGDAFVDANKNGVAANGAGAGNPTINGDTDILIPYQTPNSFTPGGDGVRGTAHIRASTIIYFSQSSSLGQPTVVIPLADLQEEISLASGTRVGSPFVRLQPICPQGSPVPQSAITLTLEDGLGNPMAASTALAAVDTSTNIATGGFRPASVLAFGARPPSQFVDLPNVPKPLLWDPVDLTRGVVSSGHGITIRGVEDRCSGNGSFALQVTSPRGGAALATVYHEGDVRGGPSRGFQVRYQNFGIGDSTAVAATGRVVDLDFPRLVRNRLPAGATPTAVDIDWGDGTNQTVAVPGPGAASRVYAAAGNVRIVLRARDAASNVLATQTLNVNVLP